MNQIKIVKKDNFTVVDNHFIRDAELSWRAKGLLVYLFHLPSDWIVNLSDLKNRSKDGRDSTNSAIKELVDRGYIIREMIREAGKFKGYDYTVIETPNTENTATVKPSTGKPLTENPTLPSTKELKTKEPSTKEDKPSSYDETEFNLFWNLYNKKQGRKKCLAKWKLLKVKDKTSIMEFLPKYIKATPDIKFRQHPYTFLNGETWNDELESDKAEQVLGQNGKPFEKKKRKVVVGRDNMGRLIYE